MPEITLNFSNDQVAALRDAVEAEAGRLALNPDIASKFPPGALDFVADWTVARKAKLVLYSHLIFLRQQHEREIAAHAAGLAAARDALESSPIEIE